MGHRVAVVGAGRIGRLHGANIARVPGLELGAMADPVSAPTSDSSRRQCALWSPGALWTFDSL